MWSKIKAACLHSLTVAWSYVLGFVGWVMQSIDVIADGLNSPDLKKQISDSVGADVKLMGRILLAISIITLIARLRSLVKPKV